MGLSYVRTDLAAESGLCGLNGVKVREYEKNGFKVHEMTAENEAEGFRCGRYVTVTLGQLWSYGGESLENAEKTLAELINGLTGAFMGDKKASVLTVCLGNRRIVSDAVGPLCAERIIATRHLKTEKSELFASLGGRELSVIAPGVTGDTGIETFEAVLAAVRSVKPDVVICIDALAARSVDRLMTAVQLSDTGISPGSGVGNHRREISRGTLGVPVVSIGVPTVVESSTLVYDALEKAGRTELGKALSDVLENQRSFFVTPKNADVAVAAEAELIARAVNRCFLGFSEL